MDASLANNHLGGGLTKLPTTKPPSPLLCPICRGRNEFTNAHHLEIHLCYAHFDSQPFVCRLCRQSRGEMRFATEVEVKEHCRQGHDSPGFGFSYEPRDDEEKFAYEVQVRGALADAIARSRRCHQLNSRDPAPANGPWMGNGMAQLSQIGQAQGANSCAQPSSTSQRPPFQQTQQQQGKRAHENSQSKEQRKTPNRETPVRQSSASSLASILSSSTTTTEPQHLLLPAPAKPSTMLCSGATTACQQCGLNVRDDYAGHRAHIYEKHPPSIAGMANLWEEQAVFKTIVGSCFPNSKIRNDLTEIRKIDTRERKFCIEGAKRKSTYFQCHSCGMEVTTRHARIKESQELHIQIVHLPNLQLRCPVPECSKGDEAIKDQGSLRNHMRYHGGVGGLDAAASQAYAEMAERAKAMTEPIFAHCFPFTHGTAYLNGGGASSVHGTGSQAQGWAARNFIEGDWSQSQNWPSREGSQQRQVDEGEEPSHGGEDCIDEAAVIDIPSGPKKVKVEEIL